MALTTSDELLAIFMPVVVYWIYSGMYVIFEWRFENYRLHSRKEQEEKNFVPKKTVIKAVLLQQTFQSIALFLMFKVTGGNHDVGASKGQASSYIVIAMQFVVAMLVMDTLQYFIHRYMHYNKYFYRHFHSYHHRIVVPYAYGAFYNDNVDRLLDAIGTALAAFLAGMSPRTSTFFVCLATIKAVDDHSGMLLPGNPFHIFFWNNSAFHDTHHQLCGGKYNFSTPFFVMWDRIMGTYMPYSIEKRAEGGFEVLATKELKDD
ncbi:sphinganine C4-monooxygenase 1-like [Durio zibethinus]|uniref:Sphinganine C4-monooxygenase 1-like n=1 Tax=Durio zibethinus TaxID=66656 RepID=A0A6P6BF82_DURZI|nr:sphinganine C4-monooxygenase 1-like [Durio zibethinus]